MEDRIVANTRLASALANHERDLEAQIKKLTIVEDSIKERLNKLNNKKFRTAQSNGNPNASPDDLIEINAGGKIISAKRSTLTQLTGTKMEALFSGRWDKRLQRDSNGRIFLDVNPVGFQAIVDYLNELTISSEDNPPDPPSVDDEHKHILKHQLELFGLLNTVSPLEMPESNIISDSSHASVLHGWLEEDGSEGKFSLLYRGARDGISNQEFHSKCDNQGCTLTIIETTDGYVLGGYSNTPWTSSNGNFRAANKAFLFILSGSDVSSPCKMKLENANDNNAVYHSYRHGPTFGGGMDLYMSGSTVGVNFGHTYEPGAPGRLATSYDRSYHTEYEEEVLWEEGEELTFTIKEIEVFEVIQKSSRTMSGITKEKKSQNKTSSLKLVSRFSEDINEAINVKQESLQRAKSEILHQEDCFKDEAIFIKTFASGDAKDVVMLNVSGTIMVTKRSTLSFFAESVLARQFDDAIWTNQGNATTHCVKVKEWTSDDVSNWADNIEGIQDDVGSILKENGINARELLALNMEGLKMIGIERAGTLCLLLEEIKMLKQASSDNMTLIEHSPYCFGKIVDYLRLKQLHSQGLVEEPDRPTVCDSQKGRFEKVVRYYFPGDSAKFILG